ncbi:MAG: hypothetical protein ACM3ZF_10210 [Mycobacterium leprae]
MIGRNLAELVRNAGRRLMGSRSREYLTPEEQRKRRKRILGSPDGWIGTGGG